MRVVFLGTPEFAVPTLEALIAENHQLLAVYTQPDRPKGRGGRLTPSPVKEKALKLGLPVFQPERIRRPEHVRALVELQPEVMVVVGYGQIIPQSIIDIPRFGILNVHASLLPKYRGAAPVQWSIANGETETGITIMRIDAGLDTGDMISKWSTPIGPDETAPELSRRMAPAGAKLLVESLRAIHAGTARFEPQDDAQATYAPLLKKEDGRIDWTRTATEIRNRMRGFAPWPGAYSVLKERTLQIFNAVAHEETLSGVPGTVHIENRRAFVVCGRQSMLELLEVQLEGKKRMSIQSFLNGYGVESGEILGGQE